MIVLIKKQTCFILTGDDELSFGYGGSGKKSNAGNFEEFGETFGVGDVITAYLVGFILLCIVFYALWNPIWCSSLATVISKLILFIKSVKIFN